MKSSKPSSNNQLIATQGIALAHTIQIAQNVSVASEVLIPVRAANLHYATPTMFQMKWLQPIGRGILIKRNRIFIRGQMMKLKISIAKVVKLSVSAVFICLLSACASQQTSNQLADARKAYESYTKNIEQVVTFEFSKGKNDDNDKMAQKERALRDKIEGTCQKKFDDALTAEIEAIDKNGKDIAKRAAALPKFSDKQYSGFQKCATKLGAKKPEYFVLMKDGSKEKVPAWLREVLKRGLDYINLDSMARFERSQSAGKVGTVVLVVGLLAAAAYAGGQGAYGSGYNSRAPNHYPGNCKYPTDRAADGSLCGNRAASVRPGGY